MNAAVIPEAVRSRVDAFVARPRQLLINGEWRTAQSGATFAVEDPATASTFAAAAAGDAADIDAAVKAARAAFENPKWTHLAPSVRARLLLKLADAIEANADELALLETLDNGMPLMLARFGSVLGAAESLRYHAGWATKLNGETVALSAPGESLAYTLREPVGVVGQIVPWNLPFVMGVSKIAAAIAAGCTVVLKPAEQTPLTTVRLGELIQEVGFPPGVINIVTGYGETAGKALVDHPDVDKIAFTGSTVVGKQILAGCAGNLKRVTLELGGKSPVFIFPDADPGLATEAAARGIFMNSGQVCAAGSRLFVHEKLYDKVVQGVIDNAYKIKLGPGVDPTTTMGPLVSAEQRKRVMGYIESGAGEGAKVLTGGHAAPGAGYFVEPTVLGNTTANMRVRREEIFGPVLCAMSFGDADIEALARLGNDTDYGLSAAIYTRDLSAAHKLARRLKAGTVRINFVGGVDPAMPLGGFKQSGWGRENGREGTLMYTEIKAVSVGL